VPVAQRLQETLGDLAPGSAEADLAFLARTAGEELRVAPADALDQLRRVREALLGRAGARFALTGNADATDAVAGRLEGLFGRFRAEVPAQPVAGVPVVHTRMADHERVAREPVHHALVHGGGTSGVFVLSAAAAGYGDLAEEGLVRELGSRVFGGSGPHGFFMRTWGAGLAYSNGLSVGPQEGRVRYYAERCPDLVETMRFVVGLVEGADRLDDPYLAEYAVANAVAWSRESDRFEARTRAAADDLVDGDGPEVVARWRRAVLALREAPGLWERMRPHVVPMTGRVLPGVGPRSREVPEPNFLVIAPEALLARWEGWVRDREGPDEQVHRLYPRDFWIVD